MRPSLNVLPYKTKSIPRPLNGGLNNGYGFDIDDNEFTEAVNIQTKYFPQVRPRFPRTAIGDKLTFVINHLGKRGGEYITAVNGTTWVKYEDDAWVTIGTLGTSANASSVDFQGTTLLANGTDAKQYDGTTLSDISEMPTIDLLEVFAGRVYGAYTESDSLYFSAIATYDDWTSVNDSGEIRVVTRDDQPCTGLVSFNNHIVYFKNNSCHELYGTSPTNYTLQTLSDQIGCIGPRALVEANGYLYFWSEDGCYAYGGGTVPTKISYPFINDFVDRIDADRYDECVAGTDGRVVYFILPVDTSGHLLVAFDTDINKWMSEDDIEIVEFTYFEGELYGITEDGQLTQMVDPSGTYNYDWEFITKAYDHGVISAKKSLKRVYISSEQDEGTTVEISVSTSADGTGFTKIGEITETDLKTRYFLVPQTFNNHADWNQIKISGNGNATIHNLEIQVRIIPNTY